MTTSPEPSSFPSTSAVNSAPWWWQLHDASGAVITPPEEERAEFPTQGDAESWVGEVWSDLAETGIASVTLFEGERQVYGPMSLHADG